MQIEKLLEKKDVASHKIHLSMLENFKYSCKQYGLSMEDVVSMGYHHRGHPLYKQDAERKMEKLKSVLTYETQQVIQGVEQMFRCIRDHRKKMRENSLSVPEDYIKQFDVFQKAIKDTKLHARGWWATNHQRTNVTVSCDRNSKLDVTDINEQKKYPYDRRKLSISPLWFHKVWKRGLSGVEYKGRPHFIADLKYTPIVRLEEKDMKVYKVDLVSTKSGELTIIKDFWCVAFETEPSICNGIVNTPSKCIASISPELRLAEVNVSKRITSKVINNLLD